jgi:hypothetical protein
VQNRDPSGLKVLNRSNYVVYIKGESDNTAWALPAHAIFLGEQDGIAIPALKPGEVFKSADYIDLVVGQDGKVDYLANPNLGLVYVYALYRQQKDGGWKGSAFLAELHRRPDSGWDELFRVAGGEDPHCPMAEHVFLPAEELGEVGERDVDPFGYSIGY